MQHGDLNAAAAPVAAMGLWTSIIAVLGTLITGGGLGVGFKAWLQHRRGMRKDSDDVAMSLVATLKARVEALEAESKRERELCDARIAVLRHRLNNLSSDFDALLLLIEMSPERAREFVARIKEQRARHEQAEAAEKAGFHVAAIGGLGRGNDEQEH